VVKIEAMGRTEIIDKLKAAFACAGADDQENVGQSEHLGQSFGQKLGHDALAGADVRGRAPS
jgi:hypothetical protein